MKLIKSATIYKCDLPSIQSIEQHLSEQAFSELNALDLLSAGFVPDFGGKYAMSYAGGYAFRLRYDEKVIPASAINQALDKAIKEIEEREDRKVGKKERTALKDDIVFELVPRALARSVVVSCFYCTDQKTLIVSTASKKLADIVTSKLIKAVGSVKATTIYIDNLKQSTTTKLEHQLVDDVASFGLFDVGGVVKLQSPDKKAVSYKLSNVHDADRGILEAIANGFTVTEIELSNEDISFKLDQDFHIKAVDYLNEPAPQEFESAEDYFKHEAAIQSLIVANAAAQLCELFEYKEPEAAK